MKKFLLFSFICLLGITSVIAQTRPIQFRITDMNDAPVLRNSRVYIWADPQQYGSWNQIASPYADNTGMVVVNLPDGDYVYEVRPPYDLWTTGAPAPPEPIYQTVPFKVEGYGFTIDDAKMSLPVVRFNATTADGAQIDGHIFYQLNVESHSFLRATGIANNSYNEFVFYARPGTYNYRAGVNGYPIKYGEFTLTNEPVQTVNVSYEDEPLRLAVFNLENIPNFSPDEMSLTFSSLHDGSTSDGVASAWYNYYYDGTTLVRRFEVYLPDGHYQYDFSPIDNQPGMDAYSRIRGEITVAGAAPEPVTLSYAGNRWVSVSFTDHEDNPLPYQNVNISNRTSSITIRLDHNGEGRGYIPEGEYTYSSSSVFNTGLFLAAQSRKTLTVSGNTDLKITYDDGYYPVEITRTGFDGSPMPGEVIITKVTPISIFTIYSGSFDANGKISAYLDDGDYIISTPFYTPEPFNVSGAFKVEGAGLSLDINPFMGDVPVYDVEFVATNIDGQPTENINAVLTNKANGNEFHGYSLNGNSTVIAAPAGEYYLTASYHDYNVGHAYTYPSKDFTVDASKQVEIKFADVNLYPVSITALGHDGAPIESFITYEFRNSSGEDWGFYNNGELIAPLPNGTYIYTIERAASQGFPQRWGSFTVNNAAPEPITVSYADCYPATFNIPTSSTVWKTVYIYNDEGLVTSNLTDENICTLYLPNGTYRYKVSSSEFGIIMGDLTINGAASNINASFPQRHELTFEISGYDGKMISGNINISIFSTSHPDEDIARGFSQIDLEDFNQIITYLSAGSYIYEVNVEGYPTRTAQFIKTAGIQNIRISFEDVPRNTVNFIVKYPWGEIFRSNEFIEIRDEHGGYWGDPLFPDNSPIRTGITGMSAVIDLPDGEYTYFHRNVSGQFTVASADKTVEIILSQRYTVRFLNMAAKRRYELSLYDENGFLLFDVQYSANSTFYNSFSPGKYYYIIINDEASIIHGEFEVIDRELLVFIEEPELRHRIIFTGTFDDGSPLDRDYYYIEITNPAGFVVDNLYALPSSVYFVPGVYTYTATLRHNGNIVAHGSFNADAAKTVNIEFSKSGGIEIVAVSGVTLDKQTATIDIGDNLTLIPAVTPPNASNQAVTWSSSAPSVATVDQSGKVTGVSEGSAVITVTTLDGSFTANCTVTVNPAASLPILNYEISAAPLANVYPNPTDGALTVELETPGAQRITISDMSGKILLIQSVSAQIISLDLSNFPSGAYLLIIDDGKQQSVTRIVKN